MRKKGIERVDSVIIKIIAEEFFIERLNVLLLGGGEGRWDRWGKRGRIRRRSCVVGNRQMFKPMADVFLSFSKN